MALSALHTVPDQVAAADAVIASIDACFASGFARLAGPHRDALASVRRTFAGTPLGDPIDAAVAAASGGVPGEAHLVALAAAREALHGARHDALLAHAIAATDGAVSAPPDADPSADPGAAAVAAAPVAAAEPAVANLMASARHWLLELALAGLAQLDAQTVAPFSATLEAVQDQPALARLAALLTGFMDELMENAPTAAMDAVPARRWADLWCRSMLAAHRLPPATAARDVSGELRVLGADIRHHDHAATLIAYGLLAVRGEPVRLVRAALTRWKVDAVAGDEVWTLFDAGGVELLTAIADRKALAVEGMRLLATGDLVWTGTAKPGAAFDPIDAAAEALRPGAGQTIPVPAPIDRHPAQLAVPLALPEVAFTSVNGEPGVELDGAGVPLAPASPLAGLAFDSLRKARRMVGLLRFDGGRWRLQPLVAHAGKTWVGPGEVIARARKARGSTLATLQERAGKLLRK